MADGFELRRCSDALVYRFERAAPWVFRRLDRPELTIHWEARFGWVARDPESGAIAGRAWEPPLDGQTEAPPEGIWVSRKGARSYVYDLVHLREGEAP